MSCTGILDGNDGYSPITRDNCGRYCWTRTDPDTGEVVFHRTDPTGDGLWQWVRVEDNVKTGAPEYRWRLRLAPGKFTVRAQAWSMADVRPSYAAPLRGAA
jgi:hypothetical protein